MATSKGIAVLHVACDGAELSEDFANILANVVRFYELRVKMLNGRCSVTLPFVVACADAVQCDIVAAALRNAAASFEGADATGSLSDRIVVNELYYPGFADQCDVLVTLKSNW
jgi:hypothetical protein